MIWIINNNQKYSDHKIMFVKTENKFNMLLFINLLNKISGGNLSVDSKVKSAEWFVSGPLSLCEFLKEIDYMFCTNDNDISKELEEINKTSEIKFSVTSFGYIEYYT